jgi:hypothetical protein
LSLLAVSSDYATLSWDADTTDAQCLGAIDLHVPLSQHLTFFLSCSEYAGCARLAVAMMKLRKGLSYLLQGSDALFVQLAAETVSLAGHRFNKGM